MIGGGAGVALILCRCRSSRRAVALAGQRRGRGAGAHLHHHPRLFGARRHRDLRDHWLADRAGTHGRGPCPAAVAERAQHRAVGGSSCWGSRWGCGRGLGHFRRGMGGAGAGPVALPGGLRGARLARLGARLRPREALADGGGERGYPDPVAPSDGRLHLLPVLRRRFRGRDAGRQPGADPVRLRHGLRDGRLRLRRRGAGGPGDGRACRGAAAARGGADQHLGHGRLRGRCRPCSCSRAASSST
jgi:hypothetical protein